MRELKILCLQHQGFDGACQVDSWADSRRHLVEHVRFFHGDVLPQSHTYDILVILGGAMGAYEENKYSWLPGEKHFIRTAIQSGKTVLGICLGAQLIASSLGAKVYKGPYRETGWHPVMLNDAGRQSAFFRTFGEVFYPLQWHGDTFELPEGATLLGTSAHYQNQAFLFGDRVLGIQFHLDLSLRDLLNFVRYTRYGKSSGPTEQTREELVAQAEHFETNRRLLISLLDAMAATAGDITSSESPSAQIIEFPSTEYQLSQGSNAEPDPIEPSLIAATAGYRRAGRASSDS